MYQDFHSGRGPGEIGTYHSFDRAPRLHSGIGPDEMPAIIRKDESVLTPAQMKAVGGSLTINIPITIDSRNKNLEARLRSEMEKTALRVVREAS
jgi:hypothetical protein